MTIDTPFVQGADKLKKRLSRIRASVKVELPSMVAEIGVMLERRTLSRFDREVTPNEQPWAPHAEATRIDRRRRGLDERLLRRTLTLRRSIKRIRGGSGSTFTNTGGGVRIGIEDPDVAEYAKALNRGTKKIPARQFLGVGKLDIAAIDALVRRRVKKLETV